MRGTRRHLRAARRAAGVAAAASFFAACAGSSGPAPASSPVDAARLPLAVGDMLRVTFSREPELNGQFPVDETGTVGLPIIGAVTATTLPAAELKADLEREYAERTRNQSVQVVYLRRIRVLGEVRNPGLFHVDPTMAFGDVLALAGGATGSGSLDDVRLLRDGNVVAEGLDVAASAGTHLQSGDQVFVPKTSWFSRNGVFLIGAAVSAAGVVVALIN